MIELWRDIRGYEGIYQVSNLGRVKSLNHIIILKNGKQRLSRGKILKLEKSQFGYLRAQLVVANHHKKVAVHRLVAQAFLPNPFHFTQVNHRDENKENNNFFNLEWCSRKYNDDYGTRNQRISRTMINGKTSKKVAQYSLDGELIKVWKSAAEAGRHGFNQPHITDCCTGKRNQHVGYIWKYAKSCK